MYSFEIYEIQIFKCICLLLTSNSNCIMIRECAIDFSPKYVDMCFMA